MTFPTAYLPSSGTLADTKRKRPRRFSRIISGMAPSAMKTTWVWETSLVSRDPVNRRAVAVHDSSHPFGRLKPRRVFSWLHLNLKNDKKCKKERKLMWHEGFYTADVEKKAETRRMVSILGWWHRWDLISLLANIGVLSQVHCIIFYIRYPIIHLGISCIMKSGSIQKLYEL